MENVEIDLENDEIDLEYGTIEYTEDSIMRKLSWIRGQISDTGIIIPRVPERLRLGENDAYEPQIITFGPYHHGKPMLQDMWKYKWSYLEAILCRNREIGLKHYINVMGEQERRIRSCYSDYRFDRDDFVEMMLLDGCFVVEYLLRTYEYVKDELKVLMQLLKSDILLLENQLPFFILDEIYNLASTPSASNSYPPSFTHLAIGYFNRVFQKEINLPPPETVHHLFHLYYLFCLYTPGVEEGAGDETIISSTISVTSEISARVFCNDIPSATVLQEAGIKFMRKCVEGSSLDVTFSNGKMKIPPLLIDAHTKSRLRNLVIFEQLCPNVRSDRSFTAYVEFINCLVTTPEDVALLSQKGIIHTHYSNKYTAGLLSQLNRGTAVEPNHYLAPLYEEVNKYWQNRRHKWRASLIHNYCSSPWKVLGIVTGGILLVLTLLQTIFSGYSTF